jgi:hypothetical protein
MSSLKDSKNVISNLLNKIQEEVKTSLYLEDAAQKLTDALYHEFKDSIVLVRVYTSLPFESLPQSNKEFVMKLGNSAGIANLIKKETAILSLLGSRGQEVAWNDRRKSQGHVGIPLVSAKFIDEIPMISRLMKELKVDLNWITSQDSDVVIKASGQIAGVFYVADAETAVDFKGRKIIAAQPFVKNYKVKTVFGMGGAYMGKVFTTVIVFSNELLEKPQVTTFMPVINTFKSATMSLAVSGKIFAKL